MSDSGTGIIIVIYMYWWIMSVLRWNGCEISWISWHRGLQYTLHYFTPANDVWEGVGRSHCVGWTVGLWVVDLSAYQDMMEWTTLLFDWKETTKRNMCNFLKCRCVRHIWMRNHTWPKLLPDVLLVVEGMLRVHLSYSCEMDYEGYTFVFLSQYKQEFPN